MNYIVKLMAPILVVLCVLIVHDTYAQTAKVKVNGVVVDKSTGDPAIGVSILAGSPPKPIGVTNTKGEFTVSIEEGTVLTFKGIGYGEMHETVSRDMDGKTIRITLAHSTEKLNQVVITGYQKKTRATTTGAVTRISGEEIQDVPVANVTDLLQGKVPGLNIQINNGAPGVMGRIQLRGVSNLNVSSDGFLTPTSPLFVVDGVPIDPNQGYEYGFSQAGPGISPLSLIPPEDIASIEVLKDAAAISIYGSRGAYGVIIITTKRGKSEIPIVRYTANFFLNTPPKLRPVIGGKMERALRIDEIKRFDTTYASAWALINRTSFLSDSLSPFYNNATNWQNVFFRPTYNMSHNISIQGGNEQFNYKTNLNYYEENGIIKGTGFNRYTVGMNARYQPTNRFKLMATINGAYGTKKNGSGIGLLQQGVANGVNSSSLLPPPSLFADNNEALNTSSIKEDNLTKDISANLNIEWEPVKGIRLQDVASYNNQTSTVDRFAPSFLNNGFSLGYNYDGTNQTFYNRATLSYTQTINELHTVNAFVFDELQRDTRRAHVIALNQTPNNDIHGPVGSDWYGSGGGTLDNLTERRTHGYGGALSYNYNTKYVLNFSFRFDGTATSGPSQGYSKNPAISARWNFNREPWFKNVKWIDYSSIRASWGRNIVPTGNVFDVYGIYQPGGTTYNNQATMHIDHNKIPNSHFLPQTTTTTDIGFEGGFFDNRLEVVFDGYYKSVDNMITDIQLPDMIGFNNITANGISLVDYGFEWSLTYRLFPTSSNPKSFQSTISVNGAINHDVLTKLPGGIRQLKIVQDNGIPVLYRLGRNTLSNLLYANGGVYHSNQSVPVHPATGLYQQVVNGVNSLYLQGGDPRWIDIDGNYKINEDDFVTVGNPQPLIVGGVNSYSTYNNFTLRINVSYTLVRDLLNINTAQRFKYYSDPTALGPLLPLDEFSDYWKPSESGGKGHVGKDKGVTYPNPFDFTRANIVDPFRDNQTLFLEDGSYWKINSVTLAYNIPKQITRRYGITSTRIYFTTNNLFTFSNYSGPDPENVTALGRDASGGYPNRRSYSLGLNVQF